jgi:hypothetical protein
MKRASRTSTALKALQSQSVKRLGPGVAVLQPITTIGAGGAGGQVAAAVVADPAAVAARVD